MGKTIKFVIFTVGILIVLSFSRSWGAENVHLSKAQLIDDVRQLVQTIENVHPDPYINAGGKIAFHRRYNTLLRSIPREGMSREDFFDLIRPFVATIGDSHTAIQLDRKEQEDTPALQLGFKIIEESLVVTSVPDKNQKGILGSRLLAVEGITVQELIQRQDRLRGIENIYGKLAFLVYFRLSSHNGLSELVPEWKNKERLKISVEYADGRKTDVMFELKDMKTEQGAFLESHITLPGTEKSDFAYKFLDKEKRTALLVINDMMKYREGCEFWFADGLSEADQYTRMAYMQIHKKKPPEDRDELLSGIPSAAETFRSLVQEIKKEGCENLIIDLRNNTGGNSVMSSILVYFLFGDETMRTYKGGFTVRKLSDLLFQTYESLDLEKINKKQPVALARDDYDFYEETERMKYIRMSVKEAEEWAMKMPTFWKIYSTHEYHQPAFKLKKIIVLCSPFTFSSGFNMMTDLYHCGALLVGVPSGQPGNNFGDIITSTLKNSGVKVLLPFKCIFTFPDDTEKGRCLKPHFELTYDQFIKSGYDINVEVILAQEILKKYE